MSNTSLILGTNWDIDEWPEYISVNHEAAIAHGEFGLGRRYVPENTRTTADALLDMWRFGLECGYAASKALNKVIEEEE